MNLNNRLDKLLDTLRPIIARRRRAKRANRLIGASLKTILDSVEKAVATEDRPILTEIDRQIEEYDAQPPRVLVSGQSVKDIHGFLEWLLLLQDGAAALPDRIPRSVLLAWRNRYVSKWGLRGEPWCPHPYWRCADCRMVLPHGIPPGWPDVGCPVCGGSRIWRADFSKALGVNWIDPDAVHRGAE